MNKKPLHQNPLPRRNVHFIPISRTLQKDFILRLHIECVDRTHTPEKPMRDVNWFVPLLGLMIYVLAYTLSGGKEETVPASVNDTVIEHTAFTESRSGESTSNPALLPRGVRKEVRLFLIAGTVFALVLFTVWIYQRLAVRTIS
jgi:hypothetical protein